MRRKGVLPQHEISDEYVNGLTVKQKERDPQGGLPRLKTSSKFLFRSGNIIIPSLLLFVLIFVFVYSWKQQPTSSLKYLQQLQRQEQQQQQHLQQLSSNTTSSLLPTLRHVRPLGQNRDQLKYTVRINTWKRPELLELSIQHYLTCPNVAQIQVVWCTAQGPVPTMEFTQEGRVVIELHDMNSLNERFRILSEPATLGILSVDDDVLRPCVALDVGFDLWLQDPSRLVGYDARSHDARNWTYSFLSETTKSNRYSMVLTRYCFVHVDYLRSYMEDMPSWIRDFVDKHLNCEDIAMSLWVSYQTDAQVPLLAPYWAMKSQIKLYHEAAISSQTGHKQVRDECVRRFSNAFNLTERLHSEIWIHGTPSRQPDWWKAGIDVRPTKMAMGRYETYEMEFARRNHLQELRADKDWMDRVRVFLQEASRTAKERGLIENTEQWKNRFGLTRNDPN